MANKMNLSPTPRTDAMLGFDPEAGTPDDARWSDFARTLERENAELRKERDEAKGLKSRYMALANLPPFPTVSQMRTAHDLVAAERDSALAQLAEIANERDEAQEERNIQAREVASLRAQLTEAKEDERWLREMLTDYRIAFDDHATGRRLALNQFIHDLRAERDRNQ